MRRRSEVVEVASQSVFEKNSRDGRVQRATPSINVDVCRHVRDA
jgi:hypothetical protein